MRDRRCWRLALLLVPLVATAVAVLVHPILAVASTVPLRALDADSNGRVSLREADEFARFHGLPLMRVDEFASLVVESTGLGGLPASLPKVSTHWVSLPRLLPEDTCSRDAAGGTVSTRRCIPAAPTAMTISPHDAHAQFADGELNAQVIDCIGSLACFGFGVSSVDGWSSVNASAVDVLQRIIAARHRAGVDGQRRSVWLSLVDLTGLERHISLPAATHDEDLPPVWAGTEDLRVVDAVVRGARKGVVESGAAAAQPLLISRSQQRAVEVFRLADTDLDLKVSAEEASAAAALTVRGG
jgi:hypothetical protein